MSSLETIASKSELKKRARQVAEKMSGMQPMHWPFYTLSLAYPVKQGMAAFRRYEISKTIGEDSDLMFSAAQEGINHAAAVSRFLWPGSTSKLGKEGVLLHRARGKSLRREFDVLEDSALNDRGLRNAFEHFDERLDVYLLDELAGNFFPNAMIGHHSSADDPIGKIFKLIDPDNDCIVIFNEKFFFRPVIKALAILEKQFPK